MKYFYIALVLLFSLQGKAQDKGGKPAVSVSGEVSAPLTLYAEDLSKMKRATVSMTNHDGKEQAYTGVPVKDILEKAGVTTGKQLRGKNLTKYLLVKCADGYQVLFSLAELDSDFTDRIVILADELAGKPLPADKGPFRLVVPGEKKPARSSFQVTALEIRSAGE